MNTNQHSVDFYGKSISKYIPYVLAIIIWEKSLKMESSKLSMCHGVSYGFWGCMPFRNNSFAESKSLPVLRQHFSNQIWCVHSSTTQGSPVDGTVTNVTMYWFI